MTLIEILVVLAIIGLIMSGVSIMAFKALERAKYKTAAKDIGNLEQSVGLYRMAKRRCPESAEELVDARIINRVTKDPWGSDYVITCPGEHGEVDIRSPGKDQELDTDDDVRSWDP